MFVSPFRKFGIFPIRYGLFRLSRIYYLPPTIYCFLPLTCAPSLPSHPPSGPSLPSAGRQAIPPWRSPSRSRSGNQHAHQHGQEHDGPGDEARLQRKSKDPARDIDAHGTAQEAARRSPKIAKRTSPAPAPMYAPFLASVFFMVVSSFFVRICPVYCILHAKRQLIENTEYCCDLFFAGLRISLKFWTNCKRACHASTRRPRSIIWKVFFCISMGYCRSLVFRSGRTVMPCFSLDLFVVSIIIRPCPKSPKEQGNV